MPLALIGRIYASHGLFATLLLLIATSTTIIAVENTERLTQSENPAPLGITSVNFESASLQISTGTSDTASFILAGKDSQQQLVVTATTADGKQIDVSRDVKYNAEPEGIVWVSPSGVVVPLNEGECAISVHSVAIKKHPNNSISIRAIVKNLVQDLPINFANDVVPILTKHSCNAGGCHGKISGQNGFRLSLLGFEPAEDYEHIVKEARGRRVSPAAPDQSLFLLKATGAVPHGGGPRIEEGGPAYRVILRWLEQGNPYGELTAPTITKITVFPEQKILTSNSAQQLVCVAYYSDGTSRDVTNMTQFEPNDPEMASCSKTGLVRVNDLSGAVAIMARFQGKVSVFRAMVPLDIKNGADRDSNLPPDYTKVPPAKNFIDNLALKQWKLLGLMPSNICDDSTFVRRVTIDIAGRLPTVTETEKFVTASSPNKRETLIDALLESPDYADYFANKWSALLRNKRKQEVQRRSTYLFHEWIRNAIAENKPYDQFVREIVTASGEASDSPAVAWYRDLRDAKQLEEDVSQLFLGMRIQCANCHHHPYEKWSQNDYYGLNAFFSRVGRKPATQLGEEKIFHQRGNATATNPKTGKAILPTGLDATPVSLNAESDPRHALVDWMSGPENPFFAKALVNRYWKHFMSRGLVEPEDDMRATNPPTNPDLLDALAQHFIDSKFDLKQLIRAICNSNVYQLDSEPNQSNQAEKQSYSRFYPKRLNAEVLLDSIDTVTSAKTKFPGYPKETRAVQLPDAAAETYFLKVFGKPTGSSACECERNNEASLSQCLHLINSGEVNSKMNSATGRAAKLASERSKSFDQKLDDLYLLSFSRRPTDEERASAAGYFKASQDERRAWEDTIWVIVNTKEFLFNH